MEKEDKYLQQLNQLIEDNPEFKQVYDLVYETMGDTDEDMEFEAIEIDGVDYIILREFNVKGNTYFHLINENDPMDFMYRKLLVEDGEEYLVGLDSDAEFDLVFAYEQKYIMRDIKRKQDMMSKPEED